MLKKTTRNLLFLSLLNTALYQPIRAEFTFTYECTIENFNKARDLKAVVDLFSSNSVLIYGSSSKDDVSEFRKGLQKGLQRDLQVKVMYQKEQLVGFITYSIKPDEDKLCWIDVLCVKEEFRSKGYGKRLFLAVRDQMWQSGAEKIEWQVSKNNMRAIQFYKKLGACIIEPWFETPFYVGWYFKSTLAEWRFKASMLFLGVKAVF